jgi:DNA processing protein
MDKNQKPYLLGLSHFPKFGAKRLKLLQNYFSNYKEAFWANYNDLIQAGISEKIAHEFVAARENINLDIILKTLEKENIKTISISEEKYPKLLKEIYDPPVILYYKGEIGDQDNLNIAIVGSRKNTKYGQQVSEQFSYELSQTGLGIVSGLALGIDTIAHNTAVQNNKRTIAVLGTGIDEQSLYPTSNKYLAKKIIDTGGLLISEFPIGTPPLRFNFPQRNRIISGLSLGVLVIEANEKSGALITAEIALEQNRDVFAIPGNIYSPASQGTNNLIKQGAKVISNSQEILEFLDLKQISSNLETKKIIPETLEEAIILEFLSKEPTHINELVRLTRLDTSTINSTLTIMEMKGNVKNLGGMEYILN